MRRIINTTARFVPQGDCNAGEAVEKRMDGTGGVSMRNAIFDWGNAVVLALGTGILVSVFFGGAVLLLSAG